MKLDWKGEKYLRAVADGKKKGLTTAALIVHAQAVLYSPYDMGNLRSSIDYKVEEEVATIGTNVEYAPYLEYGTSKMAAQPYLEPALRNNEKAIFSIIKNEIADAVRRAGR